MRVAQLHGWDGLTPRQAASLQTQFADRVDVRSPLGPFDLVAGADCSYSRGSPTFYAAVVVWRRSDGAVVETAEAVGTAPFPYVPGLLSFREAPILLEAFAKLRTTPDLVFVDGQGLAHPRRFGVACHLGLFLDLPTLGCAKSRLIGEHEEPSPERGAVADLRVGDALVGAVVRTKRRTKPLFVSPGHRLDVAGAVAATLACDGGYRVPEPTRLAHLAVNALRRRASG